MARNYTFIALRPKDGATHVFLRAYQRKALENPDYSFTAEHLDRLLLSQDPEAFISAVSNFFPLSLEPLCKYEKSICPRMMTVSEFRSKYVQKFEPVNEEKLLEECTGLKNCEEANKNSLRRAISNFDAIRDDSFLNFLNENGFDDDDYVITEPVLDWCSMKAFVSNIVLFQAILSDEVETLGFEEKFTHNGFWVFGKPFDRKTKERVKQFVYNPSWKDLEDLKQSTKNSFNPDTYNNNAGWLRNFIEPVEEHKIQDFLAPGTMLKNSKYCQFKSAGNITGKSLPVKTEKRKQVIDRSLYLTAPIDCSENDLAHDFIGAVITTARDLKAYGCEKSLGWKLHYESGADQLCSPAVEFYSQGSQLLYETAFHSTNIKAAVCKYCGRAMVNQTGAKPRQFCSTRCRTEYSKKYGGNSK